MATSQLNTKLTEKEIMSRTCRICMKLVNDLHGATFFHKIFPQPGACLPHKDMKYILQVVKHWKLKIAAGDGYPQQICIKCLGFFRNMKEFHNNCARIHGITTDASNEEDENSTKSKPVSESDDEPMLITTPVYKSILKNVWPSNFRAYHNDSDSGTEWDNPTSHTDDEKGKVMDIDDANISSEISNYDIQCPQCDMKFSSALHREVHKLNAHPDDLPIYSCNICGESLHSLYELKNHRIQHGVYKESMASITNAAFADSIGKQNVGEPGKPMQAAGNNISDNIRAPSHFHPSRPLRPNQRANHDFKRRQETSGGDEPKTQNKRPYNVEPICPSRSNHRPDHDLPRRNVEMAANIRESRFTEPTQASHLDHARSQNAIQQWSFYNTKNCLRRAESVESQQEPPNAYYKPRRNTSSGYGNREGYNWQNNSLPTRLPTNAHDLAEANCEHCNMKFQSPFHMATHWYKHINDGFYCGICNQSFIYMSSLKLHEPNCQKPVRMKF